MTFVRPGTLPGFFLAGVWLMTRSSLSISAAVTAISVGVALAQDINERQARVLWIAGEVFGPEEGCPLWAVDVRGLHELLETEDLDLSDIRQEGEEYALLVAFSQAETIRASEDLGMAEKCARALRRFGPEGTVVPELMFLAR